MIFKTPKRKNFRKPDKELLGQFTRTGDLDILGDLYSNYMHLVYGVCLKYLKNREESKDAVIHIFEKLIIEIPRHKIDNFGSWLHVVTKNYCLMQLRSDKTNEARFEEWKKDESVFMEYDQNLHPLDDEEYSPEKALADCIERLKNEQKECIQLFYYKNRCYSEIAITMKMDEKKVKSHLQNAKRNLKICIEEKNVREG